MVSAITVTGTWTRPDGSQAPASGGVTFQLAHPITDPDGNVIVAAQTVSADLDANGSISVDLAATDEPDTRPQGNTYYVIESIEGQPRRTYSIEVPHDAFNQTIDLAEVSPVTDHTITQQITGVPSPHDVIGSHHTDRGGYRYDDTPIVLGVPDLDVIDNTPTLVSVANRWAGYGLSPNDRDRVGGIITVPPQWSALDIELWYTTLTGNTGSVVMTLRLLAPSDGTDLYNANNYQQRVGVQKAGEELSIETVLANVSVPPVGPGPLLTAVERSGFATNDDLQDDVVLLALVLRKAG